MSDIYSAPDAALTESTGSEGQGSLERGIVGDYQLAIGDVLNKAWTSTRGAKWTVNLAFLIYLVIDIVVIGLTNLVMFGSIRGMEPGSVRGIDFGLSLLQNLVLTAVVMPVAAGLFMIGLRRAAGLPIGSSRVLGYYHKLIPLLLTSLLMMILIFIGYFLLILPGIYLSVAYVLALPLVVEKNLGPWQALEASRKAVSKRWFTVFGFLIALTLINVIAAVLLGFGLIWTIPMSVIAYGVLYRQIFGVSADTLNG